MNELLSTDLLVVGAGIAGITAAVEAAETGLRVVLIEKRPYIGGKVTQFSKYFPKMCPPRCGLEINIRRLRTNPMIKVLTLAEVKNVVQDAGRQNATIKLMPRYVNDRCTSCGDCVKVCPATRKNDFNYGMDLTKAIYIPYEDAYPQQFVIDTTTCLEGIHSDKGSDCNKCVEVCKYGAIDLSAKEETMTVDAGSIIWATGWEPYDANKLDVLGYGKFADVVTNVMMERIASPDGPTKGQFLRPSTKEKVGSVAFVQCAGSRDENHLEYCSSVCCMASLKHVRYVREQNPDAEVHVYYIDVRSSGVFEDFYTAVQKDEKVHFHRGKVAKAFQDVSTGKMVVEAEDSMTGKLLQNSVDLVVLATGMRPASTGLPVNGSVIDKNGFLMEDGSDMIACGVVTEPKDVAAVVREATGAVAKALMRGSYGHRN